MTSEPLAFGEPPAIPRRRRPEPLEKTARRVLALLMPLTPEEQARVLKASAILLAVDGLLG